jgi:N utilization substance protein A
MKSDFLIAVTQLAAERNLPREVVISAIEAALVSVYKKDSIAAGQDLSVKILPNSGEVRVAVIKTVADEVEDSKLEMTPKEAQEYKKGAVVGDVVEIETTAQFAGRIAAQTAKQVVMQRLREAERELVYEEFADREGDIVSVVVQRTDPRQVTLDLDKTEAIMPTSEMVPTERYRAGQRLKVLIVEVNRSPKGPQVLVSRGHRSLVSRLFELEVPEIYNGTVEIRSIAREAGYRTKVAVAAKQEGIDPVGSCVGLRGIRIQNIVNELHGEKIDVVQWDKDSAVYIANSLSPAQVARVEVNEEEGEAMVVVSDRHLSLAIGKEGQNARLAAKLTGWRIDIKARPKLRRSG